MASCDEAKWIACPCRGAGLPFAGTRNGTGVGAKLKAELPLPHPSTPQHQAAVVGSTGLGGRVHLLPGLD